MPDIAEVRQLMTEVRDIAVQTRTDVQWIKAGVEDHGTRLRKVEGRMNWASGAAGAIGAVIGAIVHSFTKSG